MKLRDIMHIDIGTLLRGKIVVAVPPPRTAVRYAHDGKISRWSMRKTRYRMFRGSGGTKDLLMVTEQLCQLTITNAPLVRGIRRTAEDCPNFRVYEILNREAERLDGGMTLSESMRQEPKFFPRYYVDIVNAAEKSGLLHDTLGQLRDHLRTRVTVFYGYLRWALYLVPTLLILFMASAFVRGLLDVLLDILQSVGGNYELPPAIRFRVDVVHVLGFLSAPISGIRNILQNSGTGLDPLLRGGPLSMIVGILLVIVVVLLSLAVIWLTYRLGRYFLQFVFSHTPLFRRIWVLDQWSHITLILSHLLRAGIPLDEALDSAAASDIHRRHSSALSHIRGRILEGKAFPDAVRAEGSRVPYSLSAAIEFGERSSGVSEILERMSHLYQSQSQHQLRMMLSVGMPACVVLIGIAVAFVNGSIFSLLVEIADSIANGV